MTPHDPVTCCTSGKARIFRDAARGVCVDAWQLPSRLGARQYVGGESANKMAAAKASIGITSARLHNHNQLHLFDPVCCLAQMLRANPKLHGFFMALHDPIFSRILCMPLIVTECFCMFLCALDFSIFLDHMISHGLSRADMQNLCSFKKPHRTIRYSRNLTNIIAYIA